MRQGLQIIVVLVIPTVAATLTGLAGCAPPEGPPAAITSSPDSISPEDAPARVLYGASARLLDNITVSDVGRTFGVPDNQVPYPDTYWPYIDDGIDRPWNSAPSPLVKYMSIADPRSTAAAQDWEHRYHGSALPGVSSWWGHCPGWVAAAMDNAPILHPVFAIRSGAGRIAACTPGQAGCVRFEIADINALEAEAWNDAAAVYAGARCDKKPSDIGRDSYGRIIRDGSGCKGLNAGALLVVLGNRLKQGQPFAIDAQNEYNTDEIWNQPAYRYTVNRFEVLAEAEAANLVAYGTRTGSISRYLWNAAARGWALVDISLAWVGENGPNLDVVSGLDSTRTTRFVAVIELDQDGARPEAQVIGGEYIEDRTAGANRLTVPPFVWIVLGPGPENVPFDADTSHHNPYVRPSLVEQLVALGTRP